MTPDRSKHHEHLGKLAIFLITLVLAQQQPVKAVSIRPAKSYRQQQQPLSSLHPRPQRRHSNGNNIARPLTRLSRRTEAQALSPEDLKGVGGLLLMLQAALPDTARESLISMDKKVLPDSFISSISTDTLLEVDLGVLLIGLAYLTARPGVLQGSFDALIRAPLAAAAEKVSFNLKPEQISVESQLGTGGFGVVYKAKGYTKKSTPTKASARSNALNLVVKKVRLSEEYAREAGDVEVYMNRRVTREAPNAAATFLGTIDYGTDGSNTQQKWLVWEYAGDQTLEDVLRARDFPFNVEERLFGKKLQGKDPAARETIIVKKLMYQLLRCISSLHKIGICHRDVKPENILITDKGDVRLIDLGASVDLRNGYNYYPNFTLLDPGYAAPETYVMPESTPEPPPPPVAALLSPLLWLFNKPDRFDTYSAGLVFLQMLLPRLRQRSGLREFNNAMRSNNYDILKVRQSGRGGLEWDRLDPSTFSLISRMVCAKGKRISSESAMRHPFFLSDLPSILI